MGPQVHFMHAGLAESVATWKAQWDPLVIVIFDRTDITLGYQVTCDFLLHLLLINIYYCKNSNILLINSTIA